MTRCVCWPRFPLWPLEAARSESLWDPGSALRVNFWPKQTLFEQCRRVFSCVRTRRQIFALFRESLGVSRINHILRVHGHTILQEKRAAEINRSFERLFLGLTEDSSGQATISAGQPCTLWSTHCSQTAHLGDDSRCSHGWFSPATTFGDTALPLLLKQPPPPTLKPSTMKTKLTAKLYVQKAAQAADEA